MQNFSIQETAQHKIITVAHRGVFGGNIPCNTLTSYEIALHQGADKPLFLCWLNRFWA